MTMLQYTGTVLYVLVRRDDVTICNSAAKDFIVRNYITDINLNETIILHKIICMHSKGRSLYFTLPLSLCNECALELACISQGCAKSLDPFFIYCNEMLQ